MIISFSSCLRHRKRCLLFDGSKALCKIWLRLTSFPAPFRCSISLPPRGLPINRRRSSAHLSCTWRGSISQRLVLKIPQGQGRTNRWAPFSGVIFPLLHPVYHRSREFGADHAVAAHRRDLQDLVLGEESPLSVNAEGEEGRMWFQADFFGDLGDLVIRPLMTIEIPVSASLSFNRNERTASRSEKQPATP